MAATNVDEIAFIEGPNTCNICKVTLWEYPGFRPLCLICYLDDRDQQTCCKCNEDITGDFGEWCKKCYPDGIKFDETGPPCDKCKCKSNENLILRPGFTSLCLTCNKGRIHWRKRPMGMNAVICMASYITMSNKAKELGFTLVEYIKHIKLNNYVFSASAKAAGK